MLCAGDEGQKHKFLFKLGVYARLHSVIGPQILPGLACRPTTATIGRNPPDSRSPYGEPELSEQAEHVDQNTSPLTPTPHKSDR